MGSRVDAAVRIRACVFGIILLVMRNAMNTTDAVLTNVLQVSFERYHGSNFRAIDGDAAIERTNGDRRLVRSCSWR